MSTWGRVKSFHKSKLGEVIRPYLAPRLQYHGVYLPRYCVVDLKKDGRSWQFTVRRLVAQTCMDSDVFRPNIDHRDGVTIHNYMTHFKYIMWSGKVGQGRLVRSRFPEAWLSTGLVQVSLGSVALVQADRLSMA